MKKDIHPKYDKAKVECSCGNKFETRSTENDIHVDLCSECHPFYTGTQKFIDTAGRVDKFKEKMQKAKEHKENRKKKEDKPKLAEKKDKENQ